MTKKIEKLTGKKLASYIEQHKQEFMGNGDKLCLAAGYGIRAEGGDEKCDFSDFVRALSVEENMTEQPPVEDNLDC